ncbi:MAG: hypothetical protein RSD04_01645 [Clostridia bacterium]
MENVLLTPSQLWADYSPQVISAIAYKQYQDKGDYFYFETYCNGEKYSDGAVRIFVRGYAPKKHNGKVVVVVEDCEKNKDETFFLSFVRDGNAVVVFDYLGKTNGVEDCTIYPQSISYANFVMAGEHLTKATPSARETCVFVWAKACRIVLSLVKQMFGEQSTVILCGIKNGSEIAWQVAAQDARVNGFVSFLNFGWKEYCDISKYDANGDIAVDDEKERWLMACSVQAYAKFVACPTLLLSASNNAFYSFDRLENTIGVMEKSPQVTNYTCAGLANSIDESATKLTAEWLRRLGSNQKLPQMPTLSFAVENNQVFATVAADMSEDITQIEICYSLDETDSAMRNWNKINVSLANLRQAIALVANNKKLFGFATVSYKSGFAISSVEAFLRLENKEIEYSPLKKCHIIFERKNGTAGWVAENQFSYTQYIKPLLVAGGLDIMGITADDGNLSTYLVGEAQYGSDETNLFQFDAFCEQEIDCDIVLSVKENKVVEKYIATVKLAPNKWKKFTLGIQDFKNSSRLSLKNWENIKKLSFSNVKGKLFNNILWV